MKITKGNNDKGKEVPTLPAGNGGIKSVKYGIEVIHLCVCTFDFPSVGHTSPHPKVIPESYHIRFRDLGRRLGLVKMFRA